MKGWLDFPKEWWVTHCQWASNSCLLWLSLKDECVFWRLRFFCVVPFKGICHSENWSGRPSRCCSLFLPQSGVKGLLLFTVRMTLHTMTSGWRCMRQRPFLPLWGRTLQSLWGGLLMHKSRHAWLFNLFFAAFWKPQKNWMQLGPW